MVSIRIKRAMAVWLVIAMTGLAWHVMGGTLTAVALAAAVSVRLGVRWFRTRLSLPPLSRNTLGLPMAGACTLAIAALLTPMFGGLDADHVARTLAAGLTAEHLSADGAWRVLGDLLIATAIVGATVALDLLRRPSALGAASLDAVGGRVRTILAQYGEDSLSPFVLRPDKLFETTADGLVAFTVLRDTVVISADPVGSTTGAGEALTSLVRRARAAGLNVVCYGASERSLPIFRQLGMHALCAGEEAVVAPADFSLEGRAVRKLRQSMSRIERRGWTVHVSLGRDIDTQLEAEIAGLDARWRAEHPQMLGFAMSMGPFELPIGPDDLFVLARSPEGEIRGVLRFLAHADKLSLDVMRRVGETPNGLIEVLVCHALSHARETGIAEVSLNYAGLAHLLRPNASAPAAGSALLRRVLAPLRRRFQMDRLIAFNDKFSPHWRPRYLVYESRRGLPRAIYRVLQAEGYLRTGTARPRRESQLEHRWHAAGEGAGR